MEWWEAIIMGIIQGLTEFLPISSSGHLFLAERIFGIAEADSLFFFIMLHFSTVIAVIIVMFKSVRQLIKWPLPNKFWYLIIATIPAAVIGLLIKLFCEDAVNEIFGGSMLWLMFLITAILLFTTEIIAKARSKKAALKAADTSKELDENGNVIDKEKKEITLRQALIMGCAQGMAVLPGISRSGSTICAGILQGADRKKVADFSFLMSVIIILGTTIIELALKINDFGDIDVLNIFLGMIAAFVTGFFAIKFMLKIIGQANFKWFALYLVVLSIITLSLQLSGII